MDITKAIVDYKNNDKAVRFHMPGHKGRGDNPFLKEFAKIDITELSFSDNLNNPRKILSEMKHELKKIYNTNESFILVNGSTCGILAAINSLLNESETILMGRNSHMSAYNALILSKAEPIFIYPNEYGYISEDDFIKEIDKNDNIKCLFLTYPDYFGRCLDLKKLAKKCKQKNIKIIVDQAHGAHLYFSEDYPISALKCDVDIVIESLHKTLSCPTQTAILHLVNQDLPKEKIKSFIRIFQSTSPSYPLIIGAWEGIKSAQKNGKNILSNYKIWYNEFLEKINELSDFALYGEEAVRNEKIYDYDPFKLWIKTKKNGYLISKLLEEKYNIFLEMDKEDGILAYSGMGTEKSDLDILFQSLKKLENSKEYKTIPDAKQINYTHFTNIEKKMNISEAFNSDKVYCDINEITGKIASDFIIPYPPGYPIIIPGEKIKKEICEYILRINENQQILGVNNSKIFIVKG